MEKRQLGSSDLNITTLGFGAWAVGGAGWAYAWGAQDDQASIDAITRALDLGVNWIDTAAIYGLGHSEEVVARAIAGRSPRPYVFTKCGLVPRPDGSVARTLRRESILSEVEASLKRLRVDVIDLYQVHWPNEDLEEAWGTLADLKRQGKVRHIGVSNFDVAGLRACQAIEPVTSLQPPYSLIDRHIEPEILPFCGREGIGVIVYSPMYSGLLSGAMTEARAAALPSDDWRSRSPEFRSPRLERNLALVDVLRKVGERHGRGPGEAAIAWTLRRPEVTGAIVGARSAEQVDGWIGAASLALGPDDIAEIDAFLADHP
jgi:aryl-alcohol dehydrogenase-like predicted oxidoreductase